MPTNRQLFINHLAQTSDAPLLLEIERAEGCKMWDTDGKEYLDLISGISVSNIGHCHPRVVEAVQKQAATYMHLMVYGEYVQSPQVRLAERLSSVLPEKLNSVYLVNSGAEAAEGAMKLAKRVTGNAEIIYAEGAYHGSTMGALSVMGDEFYRRNYRPLVPGNRMIRYGETEDLEHIGLHTAAVIIETVQAETGITPPSIEYMQALRQRCNETCTLLILDEIQCGMGRTGKLFAFEHFGIEPDILLLAKGLGGGMPIGAFIASRQLMSVLQHNPVLGHITTFGGHPVCAAGADASLEVIIEERLWEGVGAKNQLLSELIDYPEKRSMGLLMSLQFQDYETNKAIIDRCIANGVITDWFLYNPAALRIAPPLTISEEEIRFACEVINESVAEVLA